MKRIKIVAVLEIEDDEVFDAYESSCSAMTKDDSERTLIQTLPEAIRSGKVLVSYAQKGNVMNTHVGQDTHIHLTIGIESTEPIKKVAKITSKKRKIDPRDKHHITDAFTQAFSTFANAKPNIQPAGQYAMVGGARSGKTAFQLKIEELERARQEYLYKPDTPTNRRGIEEITKVMDYEIEMYKKQFTATAPPPIMIDIENTPKDILKRFGISEESYRNLKKKSGN